MRNVRIICVGKTQDKYIKTGLEINKKKVKRYCKLEWVTIKEANYSSGSIHQWQKQEAEKISKHLNPRNFSIFCDETGESISSVKLADHFNKWSNQGHSGFDFYIGGAFGFSKEIKKQANYLLSLSQMTMTHQMVRLFLIEQIYRAYTIVRKEKYHH